MSKADRGRPPAGFEFWQPDRFERYRIQNFEMRPTKIAAKVYDLHFERGRVPNEVAGAIEVMDAAPLSQGLRQRIEHPLRSTGQVEPVHQGIYWYPKVNGVAGWSGFPASQSGRLIDE